MSGSVKTSVYESFEDLPLDRDEWNDLLHNGIADHIYLTWEFQRAWWDVYGRGQLMLIVAERSDKVVAVAPFYVDAGMVFFIASVFESDYLDFIGDADATIVEALVGKAVETAPSFVGMRLYFVSSESGTSERLAMAAQRLGLNCYREDDMRAARLHIDPGGDKALSIANGRRYMKLERWYETRGPLEVVHLTGGLEILRHLDAFFAQHVKRWEGTPTPSRFGDEKPRRLLERYTLEAADSGCLRFSLLRWQGRVIAYHYGYRFAGRYYWGMPSFEPDVSQHSPGRLLTRHLLLAAVEEEARVFDMGTGTQPFKMELADHTVPVHTWGLYPAEAK
jgi:CelD/BcsL family acetyltransferase involved in cellulose biosynthesis